MAQVAVTGELARHEPLTLSGQLVSPHSLLREVPGVCFDAAYAQCVLAPESFSAELSLDSS